MTRAQTASPRTGALLALIAAVSIVAAGCAADGERRVSQDLILTAIDAGIWPVPLIAGRLMHFTEEHDALPLAATGDPQSYSATVALDPLPADARLSFTHFVAPPVLRAGGASIRVEALDAGGAAVLSRDVAFGKRRLSRVQWFLRERWRVYYEQIRFFDEIEVDLTPVATTATALRFTVTAPEPDADARKKYEKWAGYPMPAPFAIGRPVITSALDGAGADNFNVLWIIVDALRADAVGAYGYRRPTTPNIDALAEDGVLVTHVYAPSNATRPSVTAMLSGRRPSTLGLPLGRWDLTATEKAAFRRLTTGGWSDAAFDGLPALFRRRGYVAAHIGSDPFIQAGTPIGAAPGFARTMSYNRRQTDTESITRDARAFLRENAGRPFFLFMHYNNGHGPLRPPERFRGQFSKPIDPDPRVWPETYDGEIAYADEKIGELIRDLARLGIDKSTLVVIAGDHGEGFEAGHPPGHAHSLYDGETRVPLILRLPGHARAGTRVEGPATLLDVYPTINAMLGIDRPPAAAGQNLLDRAFERERAYVEGPGVTGFALREWKFVVKDGPYDRVRGNDPADGGRFIELYNLDADPRETANIVGAEPQLVDELKTELAEQRARLGAERASQISALLPHLTGAGALYPERAEEAVNIAFSAGPADKRFYGTVRCDDGLLSLGSPSIDAQDSVEMWSSGVGFSFAVSVPAGSTKIVSFTPWPPDAPFNLAVYNDGRTLNANRVLAGPYRLAYVGNPGVFGGARDYRLTASDAPPPIDPSSETAIGIWYSPRRTKADTLMTGTVRDALRDWGYVR
ncbi:sulfatase-like hydrolase/transferase [bacterium]|nr:sulfatase-like hydrolase/transferase [bacterium]